MVPRIEPTSEQLDLVRSGTASAPDIAAVAGCCVETVRRWALEAGVQLPRHDYRADRVDHEFFRKWSPEMAYVLGFIAADGCITISTETRGSLEITVASRDRDLMVAIREHMRIKRRIYDRRNSSGGMRSTLGVGSVKLINDLRELGIGPRKSATLEWPTELPDEFVSPFVLGYFDGDGSIDVVKTNNHGHRYMRLRVRFTGTYEFLEQLADHAWSHVGWMGSLNQDRRSPNVWTLSYVGRGAEAVARWMYSRCVDGLHLARKKVVFDEYDSSPALREHRMGKITFDDAEAIRAAWAAGGVSQKELGARYGVTPSNISAIVRGKSFLRRHYVRS